MFFRIPELPTYLNMIQRAQEYGVFIVSGSLIGLVALFFGPAGVRRWQKRGWPLPHTLKSLRWPLVSLLLPSLAMLVLPMYPNYWDLESAWNVSYLLQYYQIGMVFWLLGLSIKNPELRSLYSRFHGRLSRQLNAKLSFVLQIAVGLWFILWAADHLFFHFESPLPYRLMFIVSASVFLMVLIELYEHRYFKQQALLEPAALHVLAQIARAGVFILAGLITLQALEVPLSGLLTFGGMGTIIIGLAGKELLSNYMSSFMIFFERPFVVGEQIRPLGRDWEGVVESIGWRSCAIRLQEGELMYLPNHFFTANPILNLTRMNARRIELTFVIAERPIETLLKFVQALQATLESHPDLVTDKYRAARFHSLALEGPKFQIVCYSATSAWEHYSKIKQDVLFRVLKVIQEHDVDLYAPSLHIPESSH